MQDDGPLDPILTLRPAARGAMAAARPAYLLVLDHQSARTVPLPPCGELTLGRAPECELCLPDASVSRRHAQLRISPDDIQIVDLQSFNGTCVGGALLPAGTARSIGHGDVLTLGDYTLVLHRQGAPVGRPPLAVPALRQRLEEEIDRAQRAGRPLGVLCLLGEGAPDRGRLLPALGPLLRLGDGACLGDGGELVLLLPERSEGALEGDAARLLEALGPLWPGLRGGLGRCPDDGGDAEALLSLSRAAAAAAAAGEVAGAERTALTLDLGGRAVVLADPAMLRLYALLERLAASDLPVLLCGETGTGKEIAAAALHHHSRRRERPLVTLNCAAIPEGLFESELFGYERGAFSGATGSKRGYLEAAHGGTLFLDELGELPLGVQAKLLRVLEGGRFARLGDTREREVDVRLVAATNRDLEAEVRAGRFRQDLRYRLEVARLTLPPLRDRRRELPILARALLAAACARAGRPALTLSSAATARLLCHGWPGNVRELRNAMDYVVATAEGEVVEPWHLPEAVLGDAAPEEIVETAEPPPSGPVTAPPAAFRPIDEEVRELERTRMAEALQASGWHHGRAAALIAMPRRTFAAKYKLYDLAALE